MLELYSSQRIDEVPGFRKSNIASIRQRRRTLETLKDPSHVPKYKYIDNSKVLQLAYLDKIIEECDEDQDQNKIKHLVKKTKRVMHEQEEKIRVDHLKIELEIKKDDDFEYQIKFDKSFYGKDNVNVLNRDRFQMRNKIVECIGAQQAKKGISGKSDLFWISKKKPFSKEFIKKFPALNASKDDI